MTGAAADHRGVPGSPAGVNGEVFDEMMATGGGRRRPERTRVIEGEGGVIHMHYRVQR